MKDSKLINRYKSYRQWFSVGEVMQIAERTIDQYENELQSTKEQFLSKLENELRKE